MRTQTLKIQALEGLFFAIFIFEKVLNDVLSNCYKAFINGNANMSLDHDKTLLIINYYGKGSAINHSLNGGNIYQCLLSKWQEK